MSIALRWILTSALLLAAQPGAADYAFLENYYPSVLNLRPYSSFTHPHPWLQSVWRDARGSYHVYLDAGKDGSLGNVQVSPVGPGNHRCQVASWVPQEYGEGVVVRVLCFDRDGYPADGRFTVLYHDSVPDSTRLAYFWMDRATVGPVEYTPRRSYLHNTAGSGSDPGLTVRRTGSGIYRVTITGWWNAERSFLVTAYGTQPRHCNLASDRHEVVHQWPQWSERRVVAEVRCYDPRGVLTDSRFSFAMVQERGYGSQPGFSWEPISPRQQAAYAFFDQPGRDSVAVPLLWWSTKSNQPPEKYRLGKGRYTAYFANQLDRGPESAFVTAKSPHGDYCAIDDEPIANGVIDRVLGYGVVGVRCYAADGVPSDTEFFLTILRGSNH